MAAAKRVQFKQMANYHVLETEAVREECWYSALDFGTMERERRANSRALRRCRGNRDIFDYDNYSLRGLEITLDVDYSMASYNQRKAVRAAVLAEQRLQRDRNCSDPESIMKASCDVSEWSRQLAQDMAKNDSRILLDDKVEFDHWELVKMRARRRKSASSSSESECDSDAC